MIKYRKENIERQIPEKVICDICKKEYDYKEDIMETQEFLHINFEAGYGSVFGDTNIVKADICQHCLKEKLGGYLIVKEMETF